MPSISNSKITINKLHFHAFHGVLPQERIVGNDYEVSLQLTYDYHQASMSDDVSHTINYAEVYEVLLAVMQSPANLLETVAYRMAEAVLQQWPLVQEVDVEVLKLNPPMGADCHSCGVKLHLINDKTKS